MLFVLILTSALLGLVLAYLLWTRHFHHWEKKGVPSDKPSFPYGNVKNIFDAKETMSDLFLRLTKKWPNAPLIGFYGFFKPMLIVTDPDLVKTVLVTDFHKFTDSNFHLSDSDKVLRRVSFWVKGHKTWKEIRSRFTPSFTGAKLKSMVPIMCDSLRRHIDMQLNNNVQEKLDESEMIALMLKDSILRISLSIEIDLMEVKKDSKSDFAMLLRHDFFTERENFHLLHSAAMLAPWMHKFLDLSIMSKEMQTFFAKFVTSCVQERRKSKMERPDILQSLINGENKLIAEGREGYNEIDWAANLLTVLVDSTETVGLVFNSILVRLALHSTEQEKLRHDILQVGSSICDFDYDKLNSIKRMDLFINETVRIHPPLYALSKMCTETTKLGGVIVEKGTSVFIPVSRFNWDPKYHDDPMTFNPDRFSSSRTIPPCVFMPFGEGPRACLGQRYALIVMKVLIVGFLLNFRISVEDFDEKTAMKFDKKSPFLLSYEKKPKFNFQPLNGEKATK